ncbi:MAG: response regulator [Quinella sp. 1Q5]|nr:response regulator [Quinella sp. 1Q5]
MSKKKILVIDDDEMNLQIAKMILERKLPCEVLCADNGIDGLEILRNQRVNLVLLDIMMPDFDGIETLQEIRDDETIKNVPVMMLTASGDIENIQKVGELNVKDYIKKPFMPADLIKRVEKKLAETPSESILLLGDDENILQGMRKLIEENFQHEVLIATSILAAEKLLHEQEITLVIALADMKFVEGFKFLKLMASEKYNAIPFALTNSDKLLEIIEKVNSPQTNNPLPESEKESIDDKTPAKEDNIKEPTILEEIPTKVVTHPEKKKLANVVTNLIGYELDRYI